MRDTLKKARKTKGLQVVDLARKLHISASFYYKIEQGARNPTLELARNIAAILGRSVEELFFVTDLDMLPNDERIGSLDTTGTEGR